MKQTFIINIHSFIDIITNSSTEMFIVNRDKLKNEIAELFDKLKKVDGLYITQFDKYVNNFDEEYIEEIKENFVGVEDFSNVFVVDFEYNEVLGEIIKLVFNGIEI